MSEFRIKVLSPLVADQIAAGEVVERPASIVKELVENSLDAGATKVRLEVDAGGVARLRVVDDGRGIDKDDLELAFTRHATSKIDQIEDLESVTSFGFRGEALPSIASVAKLVVHTRTEDSIEGLQLKMEGGRVIDRRAAGCPVGTDIEIRELFYNTPARLKFMKKESTESGHCSEALLRLALTRPDVTFEMVSSGRKTRSMPKTAKIEERVAGLFPGERLVKAEGSELSVGVMAILGPPDTARAGAGSLYTYVNGRFVRDRMLLRAITQAFGGLLPSGRYPAGLVAVELPPGSFDVNVHPQKTEVRFSDQASVFRAVGRVIGGMVSGSVWTLNNLSGRVAEEAAVFESQESGPPTGLPTGLPTSARTRPMPTPIDNTTAPYIRASEQSNSQFIAPPTFGGNEPIPEGFQSRVTIQPSANATVAKSEQTYLRDPKLDPQESRFEDLQFIGQAKGMFLLCEDADDLVVVDQHAAHERVTFERLRAQIQNGGITSQQMLVPEPVDLGPAEADRVEEMEADLGRMGLDISRSGADRITIRGIPADLHNASPARLLADMVLAIEEGRSGSRGELDDHVVATMACHTSIRGGQVLKTDEVKTLFKEMDKIDFAGHCPHGRPVLTRISWSEIRKRVGRG